MMVKVYVDQKDVEKVKKLFEEYKKAYIQNWDIKLNGEPVPVIEPIVETGKDHVSFYVPVEIPSFAWFYLKRKITKGIKKNTKKLGIAIKKIELTR